jgi:P2-related tail formation protein
MFGLMVRRRVQRAVSNHGSRFGLAAILRDALASLGLLRMRSEWWRDSQPLRMTTKLSVC